MKVSFVTVSDRMFFPGTLATVNSILEYHPDSTIYVISSGEFNEQLSIQQVKLLEQAGVKVLYHENFKKEGRVLGAWQLKAYSMYDIAKESDSDKNVFIGIDSDAILCGNFNDIIEMCSEDGKFRGGRDGNGVFYDEKYSVYGFDVPCENKYMSTSTYFFSTTKENMKILEDWCECCDKACFGPQEEKIYPGHGDQGVLNAVIYKNFPDKSKVDILECRTLSQHWVYDNDIIDYDNGKFINVSFGKKEMRAFHCSGHKKWWSKEHKKHINKLLINQSYTYAYFLYLLFFGKASSFKIDPLEWLDESYDFLLYDIVNYYRMIRVIGGSEVDRKWNDIGTRFLDRLTQDRNVYRFLHLDGGSMSVYIDLVRQLNIKGPRIVEIGGFHGGSAITFAVAAIDIFPEIYSVESFTGDLDNKMDGRELPSKDRYMEVIRIYDSIGIIPVQLDSKNAAGLFPDYFFDFIFIDAGHSEESVKRDLESWYPKAKYGAIIAGDDYSWNGVRKAVHDYFGDTIKDKSDVWWVKKQ